VPNTIGHEDIGGVAALAFNPKNENMLASGGADRKVKLWDLVKRQGLALAEHEYGVTCVAFSPDGKTLASGSFDKKIKLLDVPNRKELTTLKAYANIIYSVAFSPDGKTLASGGSGPRDDPGGLKLWNVEDPLKVEEPTSLKGHTGSVRSVAFNPDDGNMLASGGRDFHQSAQIKLWNVADRKELPFPGGISHKSGQGSIESMAFSPDGKTLAVGSADSTLKLWDPRPAK
jgi:WD40 repeat protein